MNSPIIRLAIAKSASAKQKKEYFAFIENYRKAGANVFRDWPNPNEQDAYVITISGNRSKHIAGYRIASALNNAFSYSYID